MVDLSIITHTARRQHQCTGCGRTVHVDERYVRAQVPGGARRGERFTAAATLAWWPALIQRI